MRGGPLGTRVLSEGSGRRRWAAEGMGRGPGKAAREGERAAGHVGWEGTGFVARPPVSMSLLCRSSLLGYVDACSGSQCGPLPLCLPLASLWLPETLQTFLCPDTGRSLLPGFLSCGFRGRSLSCFSPSWCTCLVLVAAHRAADLDQHPKHWRAEVS